MYLSHFGLNRFPFGMTPDPGFFFTGNKRGEILEALVYAVVKGDGIVKVTGEVGSGKTMLCRMLESHLPDHIDIIYLVNPTLTAEQVVYAIGGELGLPVEGKRIDEVIRMLQAKLIGKHIEGRQVVLLVEEAQAMSLQTLEEIRLFSNLETAHHKLLQIVLFGQPELDENLSLVQMRQLKERITHSFKVPPLTADNIPAYVRFRLRAAGYFGPDIFSQGAFKLLSQVSEGIVRRISILADKALLAAFADNSNTIQAQHVKAAIADSEFSKSILQRLRFNGKIVMSALTCLFLITLILAWCLGWSNSSPTLPESTAAAIPPPAASVSTEKKAAALPSPGTDFAVASLKSPVSNSLSFDQRVELSRLWIQNQPSARYSVQIARVSPKDTGEVVYLLQKLASEVNSHDVYLIASYKTKKPQFGIAFGSFATRSEAMNIVNELAEKWGYQPQLRTFKTIKQEMG